MINDEVTSRRRTDWDVQPGPSAGLTVGPTAGTLLAGWPTAGHTVPQSEVEPQDPLFNAGSQSAAPTTGLYIARRRVSLTQVNRQSHVSI